MIEEQDNTNTPQVTYVYGDDLINQTNNQGTHTFGYDGLGSTRILTDATGTVQNAYGYEAFGEVDYSLGTVENNYLFTGEQYDNNVGFYYLRARFYNPSNGRFVNMDTFAGMQFEPKSLHKYLYTHAGPINNIDPSGNITLVQLAVASGIAGIVTSFATSNYSPFGADVPIGKLTATADLGEDSEIGEIITACVKEHYDWDDVTFRAIIGTAVIPIKKSVFRLPQGLGGASKYTNTLSVFGHFKYKNAKLPFKLFGTKRAFGVAGRVGGPAAVGVGSYDLTSIGLCISHHL